MDAELPDPETMLADRSYDSDAIRDDLQARGAEAVIPTKSNRKVQIKVEPNSYALRNRIERFFNKLKHFRHIATRYDRRAVHFLAALHLASAMIWMR
jgi:transposase